MYSIRVHGNTKRAPINRFTFAEISYAVNFIKNYAQLHGILLPGRIPGYKSTDIQLLPSSCTRQSIWELYVAQSESLQIRAASRPYFFTLWKETLPHIVICRPMSDLCWVCQKNATAIIRASNTPDAEKSQVTNYNNCTG